jgi:hypothetical protein
MHPDSLFDALAPEALSGLLSAAVDAKAPTVTAVGPDGWVPPDPATLTGLTPHLVVESLLGVGGMGAVYRARQEHLDRPVALKLMAPALAADPAFTARFQREARVLARLDHPHIVRLHDAGGDDAGRLWLVMELVEGASLRQVLDTGRLSAAEALGLLPDLCAALAYAHGQGVVHRDLKPENILVDTAGRLRIADFGLAKLMAGEPGSQALTGTGQVLGTAAYMAPEQVIGSPEVDHRADLYALGVLAYELLTGHLPLGRFEPPSRQPGVDVRLDGVILRALERDPDRRWQQAKEFGLALGRANVPPPLPATTELAPLPALLIPFAPLVPAICAALGGVLVTLLAHDQIGWAGQCLILLLGLFLLTPLMGPRDPEEPPQEPLRELRCRPEQGQWLGLATGLAACTPMPVWAWRLAFVIACGWWGLGFVAYVAGWLSLRRRP